MFICNQHKKKSAYKKENKLQKKKTSRKKQQNANLHEHGFKSFLVHNGYFWSYHPTILIKKML